MTAVEIGMWCAFGLLIHLSLIWELDIIKFSPVVMAFLLVERPDAEKDKAFIKKVLPSTHGELVVWEEAITSDLRIGQSPMPFFNSIFGQMEPVCYFAGDYMSNNE